MPQRASLHDQQGQTKVRISFHSICLGKPSSDGQHLNRATLKEKNFSRFNGAVFSVFFTHTNTYIHLKNDERCAKTLYHLVQSLCKHVRGTSSWKYCSFPSDNFISRQWASQRSSLSEVNFSDVFSSLQVLLVGGTLRIFLFSANFSVKPSSCVTSLTALIIPLFGLESSPFWYSPPHSDTHCILIWLSFLFSQKRISSLLALVIQLAPLIFEHQALRSLMALLSLRFGKCAVLWEDEVLTQELYSVTVGSN